MTQKSPRPISPARPLTVTRIEVSQNYYDATLNRNTRGVRLPQKHAIQAFGVLQLEQKDVDLGKEIGLHNTVDNLVGALAVFVGFHIDEQQIDRQQSDRDQGVHFPPVLLLDVVGEPQEGALFQQPVHETGAGQHMRYQPDAGPVHGQEVDLGVVDFLDLLLYRAIIHRLQTLFHLFKLLS